MKTIEQASLENTKRHYIMAFSEALHIDADMDFKAGVKFAEEWIKVEDELPDECVPVLIRDEFDPEHPTVGYYMSHRYREDAFYSMMESDIEFLVTGIVEWRPITRQ